jgi:hypothetical protein
MHTETIDPVFAFNQKGETKMLHAELTDERKERFELESPDPCVSIESVPSMFLPS